MKVTVLVFAILTFASANLGAKERWHWKSKGPPETLSIQDEPLHVADVLSKASKSSGEEQGLLRERKMPLKRSISPYIVGGQEAEQHEYPYLAALYNGGIFCGGTLISEEWVLTAAHCIDGATSIEVVLGAHDLSVAENSQVRITVTDPDIIIHQEYGSFYFKNDVGLLHLKSPVSFTTEIAAAQLPSKSAQDLYSGQKATVIGWGVTADGESEPFSNTVNEAEVSITSNGECVNYYGVVVTDAILCSSFTTAGICKGDDGGPLMFTDEFEGGTYIRGISSFVSSYGCESGNPDGYQRVTYYLDWINGITGIPINP